MAKWAVLALEQVLPVIAMCRSYRVIMFHFDGKRQRHVSATLLRPCWCPSEGHQHGISIQSSKFGWNTFLNNTCMNYGHRPKSWQRCLYISHLSYHIFSWVNLLNGYNFVVLMTWHSNPVIIIEIFFLVF